MSDDRVARKARTKAVFERVAGDYDVAGPGCFAYFGQRLVDEVGIESGQRVLDVASGRGAVLFPATARVGSSGTAVGIDLADEMVRLANEDAQRLGINARVQVMDAEQLAFPDAAFDRVLCGFGLMFFPDLERALAEFRRVLVPDGRIGVSTWRVSQAHHLSVVLEQLGLDGSGEPGWITDAAALEQLLTQAGFSGVRVTADAHVFHYCDVEQYWQSARGTGLRRQLDTFDAAQTERVRAAFTERFGQSTPGALDLEAVALLASASR